VAASGVSYARRCALCRSAHLGHDPETTALYAQTHLALFRARLLVGHVGRRACRATRPQHGSHVVPAARRRERHDAHPCAPRGDDAHGVHATTHAPVRAGLQEYTCRDTARAARRRLYRLRRTCAMRRDARGPRGQGGASLVARLLEVDVLEDGLGGVPLEVAVRFLLQEGLREVGRRLVLKVGLAGGGVGHLNVAGVDALVDLD